jgi:mRNA interferase MazF
LVCSVIVERGDVFYADLSGVQGSEQGGVRPVLVLQNNIGNRYAPTTLIAPLTSIVSKKRLPTHIDLNSEDTGLQKDSVVLIEQMRTIDKSRLKRFLTKIVDRKLITKINGALEIQCGLANTGVAC